MRSGAVAMLGLIATISLSPFHVIGQIGSSGNQHRHALAAPRKLDRTTKSQQVSTRPSPRIPFELSGNWIFLRGQVNESDRFLWFLLDTGASLSVLDVRQAHRLGLKTEGVDSGSTPQGAADIAYINSVSFNLNGIRLPRRRIVAASLETLETIVGRRIDGIIGSDLFQHHVIELRYDAHLITVHNPKDFKYPRPAEPLDVMFVNNIPVIKAGVSQTGSQFIDGYLEVDTGATDLTLYQSFVGSHQLLVPTEQKILAPVAGIGGTAGTVMTTRVGGLRLGSFLIKSPLVTVLDRSPNEDAQLEIAGLIGGEILRRFTVIFDYPGQRITLAPNGHFNEPFRHDRSGMSLIAEGSNFAVTKIFRITPNSPAAEAGLRVGDLILAIDGRSTSELPLDEERRLFAREVRGYRLTVRRGAETLAIRLNLRKLI